jgi:hypothetical protein
MPAILALPWVAIFGTDFPQQYIAHLVGALIAMDVMILVWRVTKRQGLMLWSGILASLGTVMWFLAAVGSAWYLGQLTAALFLTLALVEAYGKKRPMAVGGLLGMAILARLQLIVVTPFLLKMILKSRKYKWRVLGNFGFGLGVGVGLALVYNTLRFGLPWKTGYVLIPGVLKEPWYEQGIFSLSYIPRHLKVIFGALPKFLPQVPYVMPSWRGLAIWITTPAFIYALKAPLKDLGVQMAWLASMAIMLVDFAHGTTGFAQFGYRFAVDVYPFLFLLTIMGVGKKLSWHHWLLLSLSVLVNLWGVIWINKFGWVEF